jgi:hypothetical protein
MHDKKVLHLQEEDDNYTGDGGTSDAEGEGFDVVQGFRADMKAAHEDRLMNGEDDVEEGLQEHGKAIAMSMAYQLYLQCAEGRVDPDWKVRLVSGPSFKHRMSLQMVTYKARNMRYPGDEKM